MGRTLVFRAMRIAWGILCTEIIFVFISELKSWLRSRIPGYNYRHLNRPGRNLRELHWRITTLGNNNLEYPGDLMQFAQLVSGCVLIGLKAIGFCFCFPASKTGSIRFPSFYMKGPLYRDNRLLSQE